MICRKCGIELSELDRFCTKCGSPVVMKDSNVVDLERKKTYSATDKTKALIILIIVICAVLFTLVFSNIYHAHLLAVQYNTAIEMLDNGQYIEAIKILEEFDGYRDSEILLKECTEKINHAKTTVIAKDQTEITTQSSIATDKIVPEEKQKITAQDTSRPSEPKYTIAVNPSSATIHVGESIVYTITSSLLPNASYVYMQETDYYNGSDATFNGTSPIARSPSEQCSTSRTFTVYGSNPGYSKFYFCYWVGNIKVATDEIIITVLN